MVWPRDSLQIGRGHGERCFGDDDSLHYDMMTSTNIPLKFYHLLLSFLYPRFYIILRACIAGCR